MDTKTLKALRSELDRFLAEFQHCFRSPQSRRHLDTYVTGQLGPLPRKSVEPVALEAGVPPRTLQEFLSLHRWDQRAMRSKLRQIVARDHADPDAIGVIDETDFPKKGTKTVGVQRQYCGQVGKVENCVATVQLAYVAPNFRSLIASDLYLPDSWASDPQRRAEADVPEHLCFRRKWQIALDLIRRSIADGVPMRWLTADEGFAVPAFLDGVELMELLYVVEVSRKVEGWTPHGLKKGQPARRVDALWPAAGPSWKTYRVKDTSHGPMVWQVRSTKFTPSWRRGVGGPLRLIVIEDVLSGETKWFLSNAPAGVEVATLLRVAASRWHVERSFQDAKQEVGMGDFEVRKYEAVQRHLAISMVSLLFLAREARKLGENWERPLVTEASESRRRRTIRRVRVKGGG